MGNKRGGHAGRLVTPVASRAVFDLSPFQHTCFNCWWWFAASAGLADELIVGIRCGEDQKVAGWGTAVPHFDWLCNEQDHKGYLPEYIYLFFINCFSVLTFTTSEAKFSFSFSSSTNSKHFFFFNQPTHFSKTKVTLWLWLDLFEVDVRVSWLQTQAPLPPLVLLYLRLDCIKWEVQ